MKWKESDEDQRPADEEREGYFEEEYSPLKSQKLDIGQRVSDLAGKPLVWVVAGVVVLAVVVFVFIAGGGDGGRQLAALEERLLRMERNILSLDDISQRLSALEKDASNAKALMVRLERLETSFAKKMNEMDEKISQMTRRSSVEAAAQKPAPPAAKAADGYHTVQKGETLYSIGKRYGLTADQLKKLNALGKDSLIQPGQKLRVK